MSGVKVKGSITYNKTLNNKNRYYSTYCFFQPQTPFHSGYDAEDSSDLMDLNSLNSPWPPRLKEVKKTSKQPWQTQHLKFKHTDGKKKKTTNMPIAKE